MKSFCLRLIYGLNLQDGKEQAFWHITCRDDARTGEREIDLRRCERMPWPRPILDNSQDEIIWVWKNQRKRRQTRVLLWLEYLDYLVVLAERPKAFILVTAYCTDLASQKQKLIKERDEYYKMQKPPGRAT